MALNNVDEINITAHFLSKDIITILEYVVLSATIHNTTNTKMSNATSLIINTKRHYGA